MSKEHAYAYEAGYRDGSINYELEHCPACKNIADLQEALAENAELQKLVRDALRPKYDHTLRMSPAEWREYDADVLRRARELGIEV